MKPADIEAARNDALFDQLSRGGDDRARLWWAYYQSLIRIGFTDDQSFALVMQADKMAWDDAYKSQRGKS